MMMKSSVGIISFFLFLTACQEVIEVEVQEEEPRLIVDAVIEVDTSVRSFEAVVKVSLTSSFFGTIPATELSQIILYNGGAVVFLLENPVGSGVYKAILGPDYFTSGGEIVLIIDYLDKNYYATAEYGPAVPIDTMFQRVNNSEENLKSEIVVKYTDDADVVNNYLFDFGDGDYIATDDEFYQGEETQISYLLEREYEAGDELEVRVLGASKPHYDYMKLLLEQSSDNLSFFDTPISTARGNIFDITDLDNIDVFDNVYLPGNFPLGFFAVSQVYKSKITLK